MSNETEADRAAMPLKTENAGDPADAAVSRRTAAEMPERLQPYRWRPGQTGNPGGRMSTLARRVRQATHDGQDLVRFLVTVANNSNERTRDRLHAAEMLLSRGWGKPLQPMLLKGLLESRHEESRTQRLVAFFGQLKTETIEDIIRVGSLQADADAVDAAANSALAPESEIGGEL